MANSLVDLLQVKSLKLDHDFLLLLLLFWPLALVEYATERRLDTALEVGRRFLLALHLVRIHILSSTSSAFRAILVRVLILINARSARSGHLQRLSASLSFSTHVKELVDVCVDLSERDELVLMIIKGLTEHPLDKYLIEAQALRLQLS